MFIQTVTAFSPCTTAWITISSLFFHINFRQTFPARREKRLYIPYSFHKVCDLWVEWALFEDHGQERAFSSFLFIFPSFLCYHVTTIEVPAGCVLISFLILSLDLGVTFLLFLDTMGACDDSMFLYFLYRPYPDFFSLLNLS
jgi:hypothetical protein